MDLGLEPAPVEPELREDHPSEVVDELVEECVKT
jgi:hypothetical protein